MGDEHEYDEAKHYEGGTYREADRGEMSALAQFVVRDLLDSLGASYTVAWDYSGARVADLPAFLAVADWWIRQRGGSPIPLESYDEREISFLIAHEGMSFLLRLPGDYARAIVETGQPAFSNGRYDPTRGFDRGAVLARMIRIESEAEVGRRQSS